MSLDVSRLENVRVRGGKTIARCPACAEAGRDQKGEHLVINLDGRFGCVVYPGDFADAKEHRKRIFSLCGDRGIKPLAVRPPGLGRLGRLTESHSAVRPIKTALLGRLGRLFQTHSEPERANNHKARRKSDDCQRGVLNVLKSPEVVKPYRPLTECERSILARSGTEHDPIIIEALNIFHGQIVA